MTAEIPDGSVVVTPTEMYKEIRDMHDELKGLRADVNPALTEVRTAITEVRATGADHEDRIRVLEQWRWKAAGVTGALLAIGGIVEVLLSR